MEKQGDRGGVGEERREEGRKRKNEKGYGEVAQRVKLLAAVPYQQN